MAHLKDILIDAGNIIEYVLEIHREKEENLLHAYCAAVTIQKYFRGYLVRRHMKMLHTKTTIIQKHWRGFLGRELYYKILKETVEERCKQKFNNCATKIQKVWRGYLTRKFIFNYSLFKKWVDSVKKANEHIIEEIERERKLVEDSTTLNLEEEAEGLLQCILLKNHHLLRTYHRKGVLSRKEDTKEYSFTEELLKSFKFIPYMKKQKKGIAKKETFEQNEEDLNVEFTLEKIKKLQRDYAVEKCKERRKIKQVNQKKSGEVIEKKKIQISSKKQTEDCKCCVMPNYRQY